MIATPVGSKWYSLGHHWRVVGHGTRDGEPAVKIRNITGQHPKGRLPKEVVESIFLRHATRTDEEG